MTTTRDAERVPGGSSGTEPVQTADVTGSVHVDAQPHRTRVSLRGEVDLELAPALDAAVETARTAGVPVEVDASLVTFMDSTGVAFLARLAARADPRVVLVHPTAVVTFLLDVTGVGSLVDVVAGGPETRADTGTDAGAGTRSA